jgi:hypothetical protein
MKIPKVFREAVAGYVSEGELDYSYRIFRNYYGWFLKDKETFVERPGQVLRYLEKSGLLSISNYTNGNGSSMLKVDGTERAWELFASLPKRHRKPATDFEQ